jgi:hypothetical protein
VLDIIVPHYDEPWIVGKPFFDMLACQRGIDFDDIRVILVHDGSELFPDEYFKDYPYEVDQHRIAHKGVSAARNFGLKMATAKWVQFCDFDDCYSNIYALGSIMKSFDQEVEYIWTPFFVEVKKDNVLQLRTRENENLVWVHGKYFRRRFLLENDLFFPEGIHYSEDSAFCALMNEACTRRGKITCGYPAYVWKYREGSVSMGFLRMDYAINGFIDRNFYVVEEFKRRGFESKGIIGRMFADAYYAFHMAKLKHPDVEKRFAKESRKYLEELNQNNAADMIRIMDAAKQIFGGVELDESENFTQWLERIGNV